METLYATHIDEKIPARVYGSSAGADEDRVLCDLIARKFMGVLVHPVPPWEMLDLIGTFQPGGKIFVNWNRDLTGWDSVMPGDRLQVEGRTFTIRAILEFPHCYSEIYVDER